MRSRPSRSARSSRTQNIIVALIAAVIVVFSITGFVWAQQKVTVIVDGRASHVDIQARSVGALLEQLNVPYVDGDIVSPSPETRITSGMAIVVRHAVPVTLNLGGSDLSLKVIGKTVADALVAAGMDPADNPEVRPGLTAKLVPGMVISVPDSFVLISEEMAELPFETRMVPDPLLPVGSTKVVAAGVNGLVVSAYRAVVTKGVEGARVLVSTSVVTPAAPQVVAVGAAKPKKVTVSVKSAGSAPVSYSRSLRVTATAYSPQQPDLDACTATGAVAKYGVVAVDPGVIPLGTKLYVEGYGYAVAADKGGAIKGNRVDVCFDTLAECDAWGRRTVTVYVLN